MRENDRGNKKFRLLVELEIYQDRGVSLWLEGTRSTPIQVMEACLAKETNSYMRDYVQNDEGEIVQLRFDKIKEYH